MLTTADTWELLTFGVTVSVGVIARRSGVRTGDNATTEGSQAMGSGTVSSIQNNIQSRQHPHILSKSQLGVGFGRWSWGGPKG